MSAVWEAIFAQDILSATNFKPWWETLRAYSLRAMLAISLYLVYLINPESVLHCRLEASCLYGIDTCPARPENLTAQDIIYANSACYPQMSVQSRYVALLSLIMSSLVYLASAWWPMVPRVIAGFSAIRECDKTLKELKVRTKDLTSLMTSVERSAAIDKEEHDRQLLLRRACRLLWFRDVGFRQGYIVDTMSVRRHLGLESVQEETSISSEDTQSSSSSSDSSDTSHSSSSDSSDASPALSKITELTSSSDSDDGSGHPENIPIDVCINMGRRLVSQTPGKFRKYKSIQELYRIRNLILVVTVILLCKVNICAFIGFAGGGQFTCEIERFQGEISANFICVHNIPTKILPFILLWILSGVAQVIFVLIGCCKIRQGSWYQVTDTWRGTDTPIKHAQRENLFFKKFGQHSQGLDANTLYIMSQQETVSAKKTQYLLDALVHNDSFLWGLAYISAGKDESSKVFSKMANNKTDNITLNKYFSHLCFRQRGYKRFVENHYEIFSATACGCRRLHFNPYSTDNEGNSVLYYILNEPDDHEFDIFVVKHLLHRYIKKQEDAVRKKHIQKKDRWLVVVGGERMKTAGYMNSVECPKLPEKDKKKLVRLLVKYKALSKNELETDKTGAGNNEAPIEGDIHASVQQNVMVGNDSQIVLDASALKFVAEMDPAKVDELKQEFLTDADVLSTSTSGRAIERP